MGMLGVADTIKPDSADAIHALKTAGLRVLMMSGDNEAAVQHVARQTAIDEYQAGVTPQEKAEMVRRLQREGRCVAMVGDGINDAPALTLADAGIAIGTGADIAQESAGIILLRSELTDAVGALSLSRAIVRTIRQNLFWAFIYNLIAIPFAAGAFYPLTGIRLTPGIAAAAMSMSSICVVLNALRLCRFKLPHTTSPNMNTTILSVEGMMCPHCERHVTQALSALPGVTNVKADHKTATVTISSSAPLDTGLLESTITQAGYDYKGQL